MAQPADPLRAGQRLRLSNTDSGGGASAGARKVTYTVRAGDTLTRIAKLFQVSVKEIMSWNGIGSRTGICTGPETHDSHGQSPRLTVNSASRHPSVGLEAYKWDFLPANAPSS